jgi:high affinity sulfate transporter 1
MDVTTSGPRNARRWPPPGIVPYERGWFVSDVVAGLTLAAVAIPECMGYTKIAGTPVVTGLYTLLLPALAFALFGSSRHLVVAADSATAAILFAGLSGVAQPFSARWLALTSAAALVTAAFLLATSVLQLGFLADFLSRTVLVGFLGGVGVSLLIGQLPDMLGIVAPAHGFGDEWHTLLTHIPQAHVPTLLIALTVVAVILLAEHFARGVPGPLLALVLTVAATWIFRLDMRGVAMVGSVPPGLPAFQRPSVSLADVVSILPALSASMFLVIIAQSAATARSFAQKHGEPLDENRDLFALSVANILAGVSGTFVVNGSPTKTAVVDDAGAHTQVAQLTTSGIVAVLLLVATAPIARIPVAALAALVFLIGAKLVDLRAFRAIYRFRKATFAVAVSTLLAVVLLGVERGIFVAIALSIFDHLRQEYHPKDVVLRFSGGHWKPAAADPGTETEPGLIIYRFEAPLFFANADYFAFRVQGVVRGAPHRVKWLLLDLVSMNDVDYTGGLTLSRIVRELQQQGITVALAAVEDIRDQLERLGISERVGNSRLFDSIQDAVEAYHSLAEPA